MISILLCYLLLPTVLLCFLSNLQAPQTAQICRGVFKERRGTQVCPWLSCSSSSAAGARHRYGVFRIKYSWCIAALISLLRDSADTYWRRGEQYQIFVRIDYWLRRFGAKVRGHWSSIGQTLTQTTYQVLPVFSRSLLLVTSWPHWDWDNIALICKILHFVVYSWQHKRLHEFLAGWIILSDIRKAVYRGAVVAVAVGVVGLKSCVVLLSPAKGSFTFKNRMCAVLLTNISSHKVSTHTVECLFPTVCFLYIELMFEEHEGKERENDNNSKQWRLFLKMLEIIWRGLRNEHDYICV